MVANNVAELHGNNNLTKETALTEKGGIVNGVGDNPNMHDILTGSQTDGTAFPGSEDKTCGNWTKERRRHRASRPQRPHRFEGRSPGAFVEFVASFARMQRRCLADDRQCGVALLLCCKSRCDNPTTDEHELALFAEAKSPLETFDRRRPRLRPIS